LERPIDVIGNTFAHRMGGADPTAFVRDGKAWRSDRFASGPAVTAVWAMGLRLHAEAWGPGAEEALRAVPALVGLTDEPAGFDPSHHGLVAEMHARYPDIRLGRTDRVFNAAVHAVLGQKVTGIQAKQSYRALVRRVGERAPLPHVTRRPLLLPPTPEQVLDALAGHGATTLGIDITRTAALREVALVASHLEAIADADQLHAAMQRIPGIGVWTASETTFASRGHQDAVSFGDYHLKNHVVFALTGAPRGTDDQMAELLEPYRPHRARAVRLILRSGRKAPKYGPRMDVPSHVPGARP
jgi:3-methyladenine DNA glycosylase/8-oxoguanine DNA glycosylase